MEFTTLLTLLNAFHLGILFAKNKFFLFYILYHNPSSAFKSSIFKGFCKLSYVVFIDDHVVDIYATSFSVSAAACTVKAAMEICLLTSSQASCWSALFLMSNMAS